MDLVFAPAQCFGLVNADQQLSARAEERAGGIEFARDRTPLPGISPGSEFIESL